MHLTPVSCLCPDRWLSLLFVDHLARHAAIDDEIRPRDETRPLAVDEKGDDLGDVVRFACPAGRMLQMVLAPQFHSLLAPHDNPARAHAIDAHIGSKADGERMCERDEPTLACGI